MIHAQKQHAASTTKKLAIIGGGNMAEAIIGGLLSTGYPKSHIVVAEPVVKRQTYLTEKFDIIIAEDNDTAVRGSEVVLLAVKPQIIRPVAESMSAAVLAAKPVIITIAAGIRIVDLDRWLNSSATTLKKSSVNGKTVDDSAVDMNGDNASSASSSGASAPSSGLSIIRAMPNTPALVLHGATGLYAGVNVTVKEKSVAFEILSSVSERVCWVESEDLLDVVTALSGSGPAYFFYFMEHMIAESVKLGLPLDVARSLAAQTCFGAGKMVLDTDEEVAVLRKKVTSPNGTTEAALKTFMQRDVGSAIAAGVGAAYKRGGELGDLFGKDSDAEKPVTASSSTGASSNKL